MNTFQSIHPHCTTLLVILYGIHILLSLLHVYTYHALITLLVIRYSTPLFLILLRVRVYTTC
jgi:hypothetical protein